jgi:hypothetical protein
VRARLRALPGGVLAVAGAGLVQPGHIYPGLGTLAMVLIAAGLVLLVLVTRGPAVVPRTTEGPATSTGPS